MADLVASRLSSGELYANPVTFMGAPYGHDLSRAKAAILGVPFDCGTHAFRIGARQGPQAIREQSRLVRPFQSELGDFVNDVTYNLTVVPVSLK